MEITTLGIDLAKSIFQLHGVDADGEVVLQKELRGGAVLGHAGRSAQTRHALRLKLDNPMGAGNTGRPLA